MNSDSRAALMALPSHSYTSKVVWDCCEALKTLAVNNIVTLMWAPGHIKGDVEDDRCTRKGAEEALIRLKPRRYERLLVGLKQTPDIL